MVNLRVVCRSKLIRHGDPNQFTGRQVWRLFLSPEDSASREHNNKDKADGYTSAFEPPYRSRAEVVRTMHPN